MIKTKLKTRIACLFSGILICLLMPIFPALAQKEKAIHIKGTVEFQNPEIFKKYNMVWLYKGIGEGRKIVDSVEVNTDGSFQLKTKAGVSGLYSLDILKWQTATFWSDEDVNIIARGYDTARIRAKNSGYVSVESKSTATQLISTANYNRFLAEQEMAILVDENQIAQRHATKDTTWLSYLRTDGLIKKKNEFETMRLKQLINTNPSNPALVYLLTILPVDKEGNYYSAELDKLLSQFPNLSEAKQLKKEYLTKNKIRNSLKKGSIPPPIDYPSPDGKIISLSSFKGKYVLVDFWASWCGPCRKSIPKLKEIYTNYKDKGFEILSVSVDTNQDAWRKAMSEETMPWPQVLSPDKDKTLKDFMIQGIPTLFLIDREGKVVEKFTGFSPRLEELIKINLP